MKILRPVLTLAMLCLAVYVLQRELDQLSLRELMSGLSEIPASEIAVAIGLAALSFIIGGLYEWASLDALDYALGFWRSLLVYTIANSIGHCLGWSLVTGGALRWRLYERDGLTRRAIAAMAGLSAVPFVVGSWLLLAVASIAAAPAISAQFHLDIIVIRGLGAAALLSFIIAMAMLSRRGSISIGRFKLSTPGKKLLSIQVIAGAVELVIVASMLYVLMGAQQQVGYAHFLTSYVAAVLLGQVSSVPAGIGVLEASLLVLLPQIPPASLIAAVASYRVFYEGLPLVVGVLMLAGVELRWRSHRMSLQRAASGR